MNMAKPKLTAARLRQVLHYDPDTGDFKWIMAIGSRAKVGAVPGCKTGRGYWHIKIDGSLHYAHRLAWLYVHGRWPVEQIDHINGLITDNRIANLREASNKLNQENQRRAQSHNSLGVLGVSTSGRRFKAQIVLDGKLKHLGCFTTPSEAHAAYL